MNAKNKVLNKTKNAIRRFVKDESGASTIVEATFVFPIMFFVLFFLIFFGNVYYIKANVDSIVSRAAIEGALLVQDPFTEYVNGTKKADELGKAQITPYRYIFGNMKSMESQISKKVTESVKSSSGLLSGMNPKIKNSDVAKFDNRVLYSTFIVKIDYSVTLPWRFIFSSEPTIIRICSRAEEPVNDTPEFIRNTDMVLDMLDSSTTYKKICDKFGKVKEFINSFVQK